MTSPIHSSEPSSDSSEVVPPDPGERYLRTEPELVSPRVRNAIAVFITMVWGVGLVADSVSTNFELPTSVHVIMLGLAASIFGSNFVKGIRGQ